MTATYIRMCVCVNSQYSLLGNVIYSLVMCNHYSSYIHSLILLRGGGGEGGRGRGGYVIMEEY